MYDSLLAYSTVDVSLNEVRLLTPVSNNFGSRAVTAFKESWHNFANGVQDVVIGFIYLLPVLLVLAVIVLAVFAILRAARRRRPQSPSSRRPRPRRRPRHSGGGGETRAQIRPRTVKTAKSRACAACPAFCIVEIFAKIL